MSYPNPYGGQAPGGNMPPYPGGAPGQYGAPAPGFAPGGYPPQGSGYPPSSGGYPPQPGAGYPPTSGYPQQPYGGAQPGYPQPGGQPGYPQGGAYGQPPSGQAPLNYPQGSSGGYGGQSYPAPGGQGQGQGYPAPGGQGQGYPAPSGGQYGQPYGAPAGSQQQPYGGVNISTLPYSGTGYQPPAPSSSPYHGSPAPAPAPAPGYGSQSGGYGGHQAPAPAPAPGYGSQSGGYGGHQAPAPGYGTGVTSTGGYGGGYSAQPSTMAYSGNCQGTVKPSPTFNPNADCETLKKAMKGFGCDDKSIINTLCFRSNAQRQQIRNTFKTMYGKDLIKELISELRGNLEDLVVALMYTPGEFDARELNNAMAGVGTTESILIEIMATRTNAEIRDIKMAYRMMFGKDLESALVSETSGYFKRMLVSLCNGARDESGHVDPARAKKSAQDLLSAGVKRWGTDEATFNAVLCAQSFPQLQAVFQEYQKLAGHDIEQAIRQEFSGDIEDGLLAIVKSAKNAPSFFAERAYNSMVGMGTNDRALIRIIVSRCEKDMVQIKQEFQRLYKKSLDGFISGDTSGKYKDALIALVRGC